MEPIFVAILRPAGVARRAPSFPGTRPRGRHLQGPATSHYAPITCVASPSLPTTFGQLAGTPSPAAAHLLAWSVCPGAVQPILVGIGKLTGVRRRSFP